MHPPFPSQSTSENKSSITTGFRIPQVSPIEMTMPAKPIDSQRLVHLEQNQALPFPVYAAPHPDNAAVPHSEQSYTTAYVGPAPPSYFPGANAGHVTVDQGSSFTQNIPKGSTYGNQSQCSLLSPMSESDMQSRYDLTSNETIHNTASGKAVIERPGQKAEKKSRDKLDNGFRAVRNTLQSAGQETGHKADNLFRITAIVKELLNYKAYGQMRIKELENHVALLQSRLAEQEQCNLANPAGQFQYPTNAQAGPSNYAIDNVNQNYEGQFPTPRPDQ